MSSDGGRARPRSHALFEAGKRVIPGGVNSPVRAFRGVGGDPVFFARGAGAYVYDVDGNEYVDYVGSWGPLITGHAHHEILEAIAKAAADGTASTISAARSTSRSVAAPNDVPSPAAATTASTVAGSACPKSSGPQDITQSR